MHFFVENAHRLSCLCVILAKFGVILVTVYFNQVEAFFIRCPADIGKITVCGITCVQINAFARSRVVNAYFYLMARHSCHRITYIVHFTYACSDVYKRILCHHALVHTVESEQVAFRAPESAFVDTEFIAVHRLPTNDTFGFISYRFFVHIQIVAYRVSHVSTGCAIVFISRSVFWLESADNLIVLEVIYNELSSYRE